MEPGRWTEEFLDCMRQVGDPVADEVIDRLFADREINEVSSILMTLVQNDQIVPEAMPEVAREFFQATGDLPDMDRDRLQSAMDLFESLGPEIMMVFACASLPFCYVDRLGVPVLAQSGRLTDDVGRRIAETAQMFMDVLTGKGLFPDGRGIRTTQKVRLMHALIRHLIFRKYGERWPAERGVPINQEDLAYTLMTFTWVVVDGLRKFGADLSSQQGEDLLYAWCCIGRILGIREDLLPANLAEAQVLFEALLRRLHGRTPEGVQMTAALLGLIREVVPFRILNGLGATMMHEISGAWICDLLSVPPANFTRVVYRLLQGLAWISNGLGMGWDPAAGVLRRFNCDLIEGLIRKRMGGKPFEFTPSEELRGIGQARAQEAKDLSERLARWRQGPPRRHGVRVFPQPVAAPSA